MIKRKADMEAEIRRQMRGGNGEVTVTELWRQDGLNPKVKLLAQITLPKGAGIGYHLHKNEQEFFHVLSGEALYNDNGNPAVLRQGDSCLTVSGQGHSVENVCDNDLRLMALIMLD